MVRFSLLNLSQLSLPRQPTPPAQPSKPPSPSPLPPFHSLLLSIFSSLSQTPFAVDEKRRKSIQKIRRMRRLMAAKSHLRRFIIRHFIIPAPPSSKSHLLHKIPPSALHHPCFSFFKIRLSFPQTSHQQTTKPPNPQSISPDSPSQTHPRRRPSFPILCRRRPSFPIACSSFPISG